MQIQGWRMPLQRANLVLLPLLACLTLGCATPQVKLSSAATQPPAPGTSNGAGPVISGVSANQVSSNSAVINWTTNEPANSSVQFGTTSSYGSSTPSATPLVTSHAVSLSGLAAGTLYHYSVHSEDGNGNLTVSPDFTFATPNTSSNLSISNVQASALGTNVASVSWTTSVGATSQVEYGTSTSLGTTTSLNSQLVTNHLVQPSGLTANTTYYFVVKSQDAFGNQAVSSLLTFTTYGTPKTGATFPQGWTNLSTFTGKQVQLAQTPSILFERFFYPAE